MSRSPSRMVQRAVSEVANLVVVLGRAAPISPGRLPVLLHPDTPPVASTAANRSRCLVSFDASGGRYGPAPPHPLNA